MSNFSLINIGLGSLIKTSNVAVVKSYTWELTEDLIQDYLSNYNNEDIKRGKLISAETVEGILTNTYELEPAGPDAFNIVLFINETVDLNSPSTQTSTYISIGAVRVPEIGSVDSTTSEFLKITFNEMESTFDISTVEISNDLNLYGDIQNYSEEAIGELGTLEEEKASFSYPQTSKHCLGEEKLSFIPGGVSYGDNVYEFPKLNLDLGTEAITKTTPITYKGEDYIRIEYSSGNSVLRNITLSGGGSITYSTVESNIYVQKEPNFSFLLNPDYLTIVNLVSRGKYRVSIEDYLLGGYTKIGDIPEEKLISLNSKLEFGTDLRDTDVCTIASNPGTDIWFLQSKYRNIFNSLNAIDFSSSRYKVIEHNSKIFIVGELDSRGFTTRTYAVDYKLNIINIEKAYILNIDGHLFVEDSSSNWKGYRSDLSTSMEINHILDIYTLIPSGSEFIWSSHELDLSQVVICRDRIQQVK